jgi:hypothetical protein
MSKIYKDKKISLLITELCKTIDKTKAFYSKNLYGKNRDEKLQFEFYTLLSIISVRSDLLLLELQKLKK